MKNIWRRDKVRIEDTNILSSRVCVPEGLVQGSSLVATPLSSMNDLHLRDVRAVVGENLHGLVAGVVHHHNLIILVVQGGACLYYPLYHILLIIGWKVDGNEGLAILPPITKIQLVMVVSPVVIPPPAVVPPIVIINANNVYLIVAE
ncbi:MAG: hypothetical protein AOA65_1777 [Candidatus Bathyarchaeota archaeon BA1]|nr:MAG: hypothetical protein AOA65_1777 [Candidatus Bathyarchaeota archaeon BA1]